MDLKRCTRCGAAKPRAEYYLSRPGVLRSRCKTCCAQLSRVRYDANREHYTAVCNAYRRANKERTAQRAREWRQANPDKRRAIEARWRATNAGFRAAYESERYAMKNKATPPWANIDAVRAIYLEASARELTVDHVVPLRGKTVCGLHWEGNLQLLTRRENSIKNNRFWPDMWEPGNV